MFVLLVAYLALKITKTRSPDFRAVVSLSCGIAAGCAFLVDYVAALLIPVVAVFLLVGTRKLSRAFYFIAGSLTGIVAVLAYNLFAFGTLFTTSQNLYDGKPFLGDFSTPILQGLFMNFLSPYRGLFLYCPLTILAPVGYYLMLKKSRFRSQAVLILAMILSIVIPYSMWQDVTAGVSFGPRFLIPAIPLLLLPTGSVIERSLVTKKFAYVLYGIGAVLNGSAALVSVIHPNFPSIPSWTTQIFTSMLSSVATGSLDVWWLSQLWTIVVGAYLVDNSMSRCLAYSD